MNKITASALLGLIPLTVLPAAAQITKTCSAIGSSGGFASGALFTKHSVAGQPPGFTVTANSRYTVISGLFGCPILIPLLDTDGDGLPDELDPDNDGDRQSDLFEFDAGTDHNGFHSFFSFVAEDDPGSPDEVTLVYEPTDPTRLYFIEWSPDLSPDSWSPLLGAITVTNGSQSTTQDSNPSQPRRKFYRIRIERAP